MSPVVGSWYTYGPPHINIPLLIGILYFHIDFEKMYCPCLSLAVGEWKGIVVSLSEPHTSVAALHVCLG